MSLLWKKNFACPHYKLSDQFFYCIEFSNRDYELCIQQLTMYKYKTCFLLVTGAFFFDIKAQAHSFLSEVRKIKIIRKRKYSALFIHLFSGLTQIDIFTVTVWFKVTSTRCPFSLQLSFHPGPKFNFTGLSEYFYMAKEIRMGIILCE